MSERVEIKPGQRWVPRAGSRAKPRTVVWSGKPGYRFTRLWYGGEEETVGYLVGDSGKPRFERTGHDSWMVIGSFRAWIRKSGATVQPLPPPPASEEPAT